MIYKYSRNESFVSNLDVEIFSQQIDLNKDTHRHIEGSKDFFDTWRTAILRTYEKEKNLFLPLDGQYFHTSLFFGHSEIRLHFNVDQAISLTAQHIPFPTLLSQFESSYNRCIPIKYNKCSLTSSFHYESYEDPVILVPYFMQGSRFLVIDGNHRVTARKQSNLESIHVVTLSAFESAMLLPTEFERSIYIFICEGENLPNFINHSSANRWL